MGCHDKSAITHRSHKAYIAASERDHSERLVMLMNVVAVAFGTGKDRQKMADSLLGKAEMMDMAEFENIFSNLASPVKAVEGDSEAKQWAAAEFDANDPAFKVK